MCPLDGSLGQSRRGRRKSVGRELATATERMTVVGIAGWPRRFARRSAWLFALAILQLFGFGSTPARSELVSCGADGRALDDALMRIRLSVDPCGESAEIRELLDRVERCTDGRYTVCVDPGAERNVFDRPPAENGDALRRTITWNPELRTDLEATCAGDRDNPVRRDPTASLLHELVHAAQDCAGVNPGDHELEAVRIENIYRRAVGLCQRTGYGDEPLPPDMKRLCEPRACSCSIPEMPEAAVARMADPQTGAQPTDAVGASHAADHSQGSDLQ
jgi:hypothetical protein